MQRDKRGRFVKKATNGMSASLNNNTGAGIPTLSLNSPINKPIRYNKKDGLIIDEFGNVLSIVDVSDTTKYQRDYTLQVNPLNFKLPAISNTPTISSTLTTSTDEINHEGTTEVVTDEESSGMNLFDSGKNKVGTGLNKAITSIDKNKLANFLELTRSGIGVATNNKIAERALEAEKPFLQDISESHRSVYGDYRSQIQGEKAAAQLRNTASTPLTSDGALQQQMMMEAQIKGQEYIDQGNAKDDAMRRQTQEVAWQQEKENQQQRQAVAMQNKQAMLMSEKNKAQIENMRDSANYSQIVEQYLGAQEQRLRNKGAEQEYYQEYYDDALVQSDVWNTYREGFTESQKQLLNTYNSGTVADWDTYLSSDTKRASDWMAIKRAMQNEIIRKKAALKGVTVNPTSLNNPTSSYGMFGSGTNLFEYKKGGTIYKARLTKRTKDNDRGARSLESSRKIAARFLEKAIDSLYTYNDVELIAKPKRKKRKYQSGGGLPFVGFTPVFATSEKGATTSAKTSKADKEDKEDLTTKDVLTLLKDMDGLPSDMQLIVSSLKNFSLQDSNDPLGLYSSSDIASRYISLINKVKVAKFNRDEYNNAFNQLKSNGGLHELAITSEGMLVGTNEDGDFKYFSPEEASKGKHTENGYSLLTNSNLLYLRANSLDAAFNHRLTTFAQNGIGMETVNKLINDSISNLGSMQDSQEGYVKTKNGELIKGLQEFYNAMDASGGNFDGTINDLYKYKYLTKSQAEQAKKAMQYVYQTLPENAKSLLKVKSDGSDAGAIKLIETLISSKESTQAQLDIDLVGGKSHKSTTSSDKDNSKLETSLPLNILKNVGGVDSYLDVDRGDGIHMSVRGTQFNLIKTPNGEPIKDTSISSMLHLSGLQSIVKDMRNIQFGDQKISPEALSFITYNNTGITRANLPIKPDGSVNFDLLESYEQAENDLELSNDKSPEHVREVYERYGITSLLNADGTYNQSKFAPFMVTEGYTTDALSGIKPSNFVSEYKGDEESAVALMQRSLAVGTGKNVTTPDVDTFSWYNPADWFGWTDTIFKGVIYIPITNNVNTAVLGANQSLDYDEALAQEEKYQNFEKMSYQRSTGADLLNI